MTKKQEQRVKQVFTCKKAKKSLDNLYWSWYEPEKRAELSELLGINEMEIQKYIDTKIFKYNPLNVYEWEKINN